jgi:hypothetical protein
VTGGNPRELRVVIYAYTDKWYVEPREAEPFTAIDSDGRWETETHLGTRYAALLVKLTFAPPAVSYDSPTRLDDEVVDFEIIQGGSK